MRKLHFETTQKAWEGLQEYLMLSPKIDEGIDSAISGTNILSYDNYIVIDKAEVDPNFDYGMMFGYTKHKWGSLISNYLNQHELDKLRNTIIDYELRNTQAYTAHMNFNNAHSNGKGCLMSLAFQKKLKEKKIICYFNVRAGELTKRVIFDFLFIQRIMEYIYNTNDIEVRYYSPLLFVSMESFLMYNHWKDLRTLFKGKEDNPRVKKCLELLDKFEHLDIDKMTYGVHKRAARQLQKHFDPTVKQVPPLIAKNLYLW